MSNNSSELIIENFRVLVKLSYHQKTIQPPQRSSVEFLNLKPCYEKIQTRRDGISTQRPMDCKVRMLVVFDPAWNSCSVDVFVQRHPESATLCGDLNGKVKLKVNRDEKRDNLVRNCDRKVVAENCMLSVTYSSIYIILLFY